MMKRSPSTESSFLASSGKPRGASEAMRVTRGPMTSVTSPFPVPAAEHLRPAGLLRWVTTVDHKDIGILYLVTSLGFFALGGFEALLIRVQLAAARNTFLDPAAYDA